MSLVLGNQRPHRIEHAHPAPPQDRQPLAIAQHLHLQDILEFRRQVVKLQLSRAVERPIRAGKPRDGRRRCAGRRLQVLPAGVGELQPDGALDNTS